MATAKYKTYVDKMFELYREDFQRFMLLNQDYGSNKTAFREQFNAEGAKIKAICQEWEQKLCGRMERGKNGVYSGNLAEKYWDEVRKYFPYIDEVGVKVTKL